MHCESTQQVWFENFEPFDALTAENRSDETLHLPFVHRPRSAAPVRISERRENGLTAIGKSLRRDRRKRTCLIVQYWIGLISLYRNPLSLYVVYTRHASHGVVNNVRPAEPQGLS